MLFSPPIVTSSGSSTVGKDSFATTTGTQDYTRPLLVGATLLQVAYDGQTLQETRDYTFNDTTGTISFVITVDTGATVNVIYTK